MSFQYLRKVDWAALNASTEHYRGALITDETGGTTCRVSMIMSPAGTGSRSGYHTHPFDQLHYIVEGRLMMEIGDFKGEAGPGTLVVIPTGTIHQDTVIGDQRCVFLNIIAPLSAWAPH